MSTLLVNTIDSFTGDKVSIHSTADLAVESTTASSSSTTGALRVHGGISTQNNLNVSGNAVVSGTLEASLDASVLDGGTF